MSTIPKNPDAKQQKLAPQLRSLLSGLRWRIRAYVLAEGLALAVVWLGVLFWLGLALDYFPVWLNATEMPREARGVLLTVVGAGLLVIFYRSLLRRLFVPLADHSMAVLLERQHAKFQDSLLTAVELHEQPGHADSFSEEMLSHTDEEALSEAGKVRLSRVFNFFPLIRNLILAILFVGTVLAFHAVSSEQFGDISGHDPFATWIRRHYMLSEDPWPRNAYLDNVALEVVRLEAGKTGRPKKVSLIVPLGDEPLRVAKGTSPKLWVQADTSKAVVPQYCVLSYRIASGDSGTARMMPLARSQAGSKRYEFKRDPLKGILESITFSIRGYDYRVGDFELEVTESPAVIQTTLEWQVPSYLENKELGVGRDRTQELAPGLKVERGANIKVIGRSNKDLARVYLYNAKTDSTSVIEVPETVDDRKSFSYEIQNHREDAVLEVMLVDTDDQITAQPHRIFIGVRQDEPPLVEVSLAGVGTAVTARAKIPVLGQLSDDYAVDKGWFELTVGDRKPRKFDLSDPHKTRGKIDSVLDLREEARREENPLELEPGDRITLLVKASDKYDLKDGPHIGQSDPFPLDVVTPDQLVVILNAKELGLRRRFEQIIDELTQTRDSLLRVAAGLEDVVVEKGAEPEDAAEKVDPDDVAALAKEKERAESLRLLRMHRSVQQSKKAAQEVAGIATSYDDIRVEMINNRLDNEQRKSDLKELIADPLRQISGQMFPELDQLLAQAQTQVAAAGSEAGNSVEAAVNKTDDILLAMDNVLKEMFDVESTNELINLFRKLIEDHDEVISATKRLQKKQLLGP
jgi:hypothetical protein